jgi:hypothetical protein
VDKLTDAEIATAMGNDPEWVDFKEVDWSDAALVIPPKKIAISIRVDEDVRLFQTNGRRLSETNECRAAFLRAAAQGQKTRPKSSR